MKKIILLILLLTVSCKSTEITTEKSTKNVVVKSEIIKVSEPQLTELVVDKPCDENGNLRPIYYVLNTPTSKIKISSEGNKLNVLHKKDSVVAKDTSEKNSIETVEKQDKTIIKYRMPRFMWYVLIYAILLTVYTFRKFIPYLNMLPF